MAKPKLIIFDLDGTLYPFKDASDSTILTSKFYEDLKVRVFDFLAERLEMPKEKVSLEYERIKKAYNDQTSIGLEKEYGIDRFEYFENTWNTDPKNYVKQNKLLPKIFKRLDGRTAILTSAPRIWTEKVLKYLGVYNFVKNSVFTGEPDIRKPNPKAFQIVLEHFKVQASQACSIGDQEATDILPAKKLGMKTVIVGSKSKHADFQIKTINELDKLIKNGLV